MGSRISHYNLMVLAVASSLACTSPSFSASAVRVSGDSKPSDCGVSKKATYSSELSGSLVGCWSTFVENTNCQELNGFAFYTETGREEFDGKLDQEPTTFSTSYSFNGIFPPKSCPEPTADKEIVGGCIYYVSGDKLVGAMRFYDVMFGDDAPHFFYEGALDRY